MLRAAQIFARRLPARGPAAAALRRPLAVQSVVVPDLGKSISEATVVELCASVGDAIKVDDVVAVLETDKARGGRPTTRRRAARARRSRLRAQVTVEVYSEVAGTVTERAAASRRRRRRATRRRAQVRRRRGRDRARGVRDLPRRRRRGRRGVGWARPGLYGRHGRRRSVGWARRGREWRPGGGGSRRRGGSLGDRRRGQASCRGENPCFGSANQSGRQHD